MTYCLAMRVDAGLVFAADTRTNAGADHVSAHRKLHILTPSSDRVFVVLTAGNLAITQQVLQWLRRDLDVGAPESLATVGHPFEAADYLGRASRAVQAIHRDELDRTGVSAEASFILGGQIAGQAPSIFLVYPQGNYVEASVETPYLQIGETKYGKPMLDRLVTPALSLDDGVKLSLISLDATMRSNVTVAPPVDVAVYERDTLAIGRQLRLDDHSAYFVELRRRWQEGVARAFAELPRSGSESTGS